MNDLDWALSEFAKLIWARNDVSKREKQFAHAALIEFVKFIKEHANDETKH